MALLAVDMVADLALPPADMAAARAARQPAVMGQGSSPARRLEATAAGAAVIHPMAPLAVDMVADLALPPADMAAARAARQPAVMGQGSSPALRLEATAAGAAVIHPMAQLAVDMVADLALPPADMAAARVARQPAVMGQGSSPALRLEATAAGAVVIHPMAPVAGTERDRIPSPALPPADTAVGRPQSRPR
jgi:hypothetical protein